MRWRLLERISELVPGQHALAHSCTRFPAELFADHFPSFPVTPGVLLAEMGAQLSGLLIQATVLAEEGRWVFPVLGIIEKAKFRSFVPPHTDVEIRSELESLRPESGLCRVRIHARGRCSASLRLILPFDSHPGSGDPEILKANARSELERLSAPWSPP